MSCKFMDCQLCKFIWTIILPSCRGWVISDWVINQAHRGQCIHNPGCQFTDLYTHVRHIKVCVQSLKWRFIKCLVCTRGREYSGEQDKQGLCPPIVSVCWSVHSLSVENHTWSVHYLSMENHTKNLSVMRKLLCEPEIKADRIKYMSTWLAFFFFFFFFLGARE